MTLLSNRVQKANKLSWVNVPGAKLATGSTWTASNGKEWKHYTVSLEIVPKWNYIPVGDEFVKTMVISAECLHLNVANGKSEPMDNCKGNCHSTVCYHALGYLKSRLSNKGKSISFYSGSIAALNGLNFGGQLMKVVSKQGKGFVWAIARDKE